MTRRIASLFMALALCLSLLPASALAANNTGKMITVENENLVYNGEPVIHEFSDGRGTVTWDGTTLTLDGINLSSFAAGIADMIHYEGGDLTVRLQGDNYIINSSIDTAIRVTNGSLTIEGDGSLECFGNYHGIYATGSIYMSSGTISALAQYGKQEPISGGRYGIRAGGDIIIGGDAEITSTAYTDGIGNNYTTYCIYAGGKVDISGGNVFCAGKIESSNSSYEFCAGIRANTINISGGTVQSSSEFRNSVLLADYITISGGNVTASSEYASGILAYYDVRISGGNVTTSSGNGNGIHAAGTISISGGSVDASSDDGYGIYGSGGITISGGTITAAGKDSSLHQLNRNDVTIDPPFGMQITVRYGSNENRCEEKVYRAQHRSLSFTNYRYFHSETSDRPSSEIIVGGVTMSGSAEDPETKSFGSGTVTWNGSTLTLNGATITDNSEDDTGGGIVYNGQDAIAIELVGENSVNVTGYYGIKSEGAVVIDGEGSIDVKSNYSCFYAYGITINGGTISLNGKYGIYSITRPNNSVVESIVISDGTVIANTSSAGFAASAGIIITGGTVTSTAYDSGVAYTDGLYFDPKNEGHIIVSYGDNESNTQQMTFSSYGKFDIGYDSGADRPKYLHSEYYEAAPNITVGGLGLYGDKTNIAYARTDGNGSVTKCSAAEADISWDGSKLTLDGATIVNENGSGIVYEGSEALTLHLVGTNSVTGRGSGNGIEAGTVNITGDGSLNVNGSSYGINANAVTISGAVVTAAGDTGCISGNVTIDPTSVGHIAVTYGENAESAETERIDEPADKSYSKYKYFHCEIFTPLPVVTDLTIDPPSLTIEKGNHQQFTATLIGENIYDKAVIWSISGNTSASTWISSSGYLQVGEYEGAESITVKAAYAYDPEIFATVTVNVKMRSNIYIDGVGYYGGPEAPYESSDGTFIWEGSTLKLNNATFNNSYEVDKENNHGYSELRACVYCPGDLTIELSGVNNMTNSEGLNVVCVLAAGDITITGNGTLNLTSTRNMSYGLMSYEDITIESGTVNSNATSGNGRAVSCDSITIKGGSLTASGKEGAIYQSDVIVDPPEGKYIAVKMDNYNDGAAVLYDSRSEVAINTADRLRYFCSFIPVLYTVEFDANGGEGTMAAQTFIYDEEQALPANTFTRAGCVFAGWSTTQNGEIVYTDAANVKNLTEVEGGTVTLYAQWEANTYSVVFNANGGEGSMNDQSFTYDVEQALEANSFTRTGYTFAGWSTTRDGEIVYADEAVIENLTDIDGATVDLYAQWTPITYSVVFNANGGTGSMDAQSFTYDKAQALSANAFTRTGYTFAGWSRTQNGEVDYANGDEAVNLTATGGGSVMLYAKWTPITYTVEFNANGGEGRMDAQSFTYDKAQALSANAFTYAGHTFAGWSDTQNGDVLYNDKTEVKNLTSTIGGTVTLYAKWEANTYEVALDTDGGTINSGSITSYVYGVGGELPTDVTKTGYTFAGWYDDEDNAVTEIGIDAIGDKSYTARWTPITYTVRFDANGGEGSMNDQTFTYDAAQTLTANAFTLTDHNFAGWSTTQDGDVLYTDKAVVSDLAAANGAVVTLFAQWSVKTDPVVVPTYPVTVSEDIENGTVRTSFSRASYGSTVTVTIAPDEGYELDRLTITDRNGNKIKTTKISDTRYTFIMPGGAVEVTAVFAESGAVSALPFIDVRVDNWFYGAVKYAYENGLMVGTGVDIFSPDGTLTRAQAVTVLWRLENEPQVNYAMNFADVANGTWYTEAVRWAASEGIVLGNGDGTFGAHNAITREQLAAILYRYAAYKGYDVTANSDPSAFTDAFKISDWAYDAIRWAYGTKLMQGNGDGTINPTGNTRRSEFATMIMRFNEQIAK